MRCCCAAHSRYTATCRPCHLAACAYNAARRARQHPPATLPMRAPAPMRWCATHERALVPAGWDPGQQRRVEAAWMAFPAHHLAYALRWVAWAGSTVQVEQTPCDVCAAVATEVA